MNSVVRLSLIESRLINHTSRAFSPQSQTVGLCGLVVWLTGLLECALHPSSRHNYFQNINILESSQSSSAAARSTAMSVFEHDMASNMSVIEDDISSEDSMLERYD